MYYITLDKHGIYCITRTPTKDDIILSKHVTKAIAITYFYDHKG